MQLKRHYADLHVHLGASRRGPVKIGASPRLRVEALERAARAKGLDLLGVVDAQTAGVMEDIARLLDVGAAQELSGGGFRLGRVVVIPGAEVEVPLGGGRAHFVILVGSWDALEELAAWYRSHVSCPQLSTQLCRVDWMELRHLATSLGGLLWPAHAFTPHRGVYGAVSSLREALGGPLELALEAVELGLSADSQLADRLPELRAVTYLSNSDAHSPERLGREHNVLLLQEPSLTEVHRALRGEGGRCIVENWGMDPRLGKYHRTWCPRCKKNAALPPPVDACPYCGSRRVVLGVLDRIVQLAGAQNSDELAVRRPPYRHYVPLELVPGLGCRTLSRLREIFGSELAVLHEATDEQLAQALPEGLLQRVLQARSGLLEVLPGGGGRYGRVLP